MSSCILNPIIEIRVERTSIVFVCFMLFFQSRYNSFIHHEICAQFLHHSQTDNGLGLFESSLVLQPGSAFFEVSYHLSFLQKLITAMLKVCRQSIIIKLIK